MIAVVVNRLVGMGHYQQEFQCALKYSYTHLVLTDVGDIYIHPILITARSQNVNSIELR